MHHPVVENDSRSFDFHDFVDYGRASGPHSMISRFDGPDCRGLNAELPIAFRRAQCAGGSTCCAPRGWPWRSTERSTFGRRRVPSGPTQGPDASGERYFVLRFAEDVGEELDLVLDTIVRTLSHRLLSRDLTQPLNFLQASGS